MPQSKHATSKKDSKDTKKRSRETVVHEQKDQEKLRIIDEQRKHACNSAFLGTKTTSSDLYREGCREREKEKKKR